SELQTITSPKELFSFIEVSITTVSIVLLLIIIVLIALQWGSIKIAKKANLMPNNKLRIAFLIFSMSLLIFIYAKPNVYNEYLLKYEVSDHHNFNPLKRAQRDGFLPTFIHTIRPTYMEKPSQYKKSSIDRIFERYSEVAQDINKNRNKSLDDTQTIIYLSESLMDPAKLPNLLLNETPIPPISEIREENIGGTMHSQYI